MKRPFYAFFISVIFYAIGNETPASVKKGKTRKLKMKVYNYHDISLKSTDFTYKSSNKKVATVDKNGKVKGKKKGKVTITATLKGYPQIKKKIKVTVTK